MEASKSLLAVLFLMGFISPSLAYVFTVGGRIGWVENPPVPYSSWSGGMRFSVNDNLVFNYKQGDSVLVVTKESYDSCNVTNPLQKLDSGVYKLDRSGPHYFISGAAGHCSNGEKLKVVVLAIRNPPSSPGLAPPAPAPVVSPAPSSLSPSPASVTVSAPAPSSLSPSSSSASAPAPGFSSVSPPPSSLSPSSSSASAPAPGFSSVSPAPSSLSPSSASAPAPGPSSVSPAPSSFSPPPSPSPASVPVPSSPQAGSAPSESPSGSVSPSPSSQTNTCPVLRMSFGLVALLIGSALII